MRLCRSLAAPTWLAPSAEFARRRCCSLLSLLSLLRFCQSGDLRHDGGLRGTRIGAEE